MRISCILATYGRAYLARQAILNFVAQEFPKDERELILVTEDCHAFRSLLSHCQHFLQEYHIRFISLPQNLKFTLGVKLNWGIEKATGDYIAKWDDDDFYGPKYLGLQHEFALENPLSPMVGYNSFPVNYNNEFYYFFRMTPSGIGGPTHFFHRSVFSQYKYPVHLIMGTDVAFVRSLLAAKIPVKPHPFRGDFVLNRLALDHTWKVSRALFDKYEKLTQSPLPEKEQLVYSVHNALSQEKGKGGTFAEHPLSREDRLLVSGWLGKWPAQHVVEVGDSLFSSLAGDRECGVETYCNLALAGPDPSPARPASPKIKQVWRPLNVFPYKGRDYNWYQATREDFPPGISLLIIHAIPPGVDAAYAYYFCREKNLLNDQSRMILWNAFRDHEWGILKQWKQENSSLKIDLYPSETGLAVLSNL